MKNLLLISALLLTCVSSLQAGTGMFGGYVVVNNGSSTTYGLLEYGSNDVPNFQSASLGSFNPYINTLQLTNASGLTWKSDTGDVTGVSLNYRVYKVGDTPGAFQSASVNWFQNGPGTDIAGNSFTGTGDQEWRNGMSAVNVLGLASAGPGTYNLEVFLKATTNEGDRFVNNGGANYIATFAIPEPSRALFLLVGLMGLTLRRRRQA